jgi:hypothetical protein
MKKFIPFVLLLVACGGDYKAPESTISGPSEKLFEQVLPSADSGQSYALDFSLEEGGCLDLVSHSNENLANGWEMQFCRQGTGAGSLKVTIFANGERRDTKKNETVEAFAGFDASSPLKLQIDVHNNESPAHALVWSRQITEDFSEAAAIFNSEEFDNSPGNGSGKRWGLRLNKATVTRAENSAPKFSE